MKEWVPVTSESPDLLERHVPVSGIPPTVLVTGGAGYIGSVLVRRLLGQGYHVRVVDRLLYGDAGVRDLNDHPNFELLVADFRDRTTVAVAVQGVHKVVHLGAIVGDPACALDETFSVATNLDATRIITEACADQHVERLVFASTCSVYGASDEPLDENSAFNPLSLYSRTKIDSERLLLDQQHDGCPPVILRFATAFGPSQRPRFDLVANLLTAKAVAGEPISIHGGDQWRPFVYTDDIARAVVLAMEAPIGIVAGQVLNVGSTEENYRLSELGEIIHELVPEAELQIDQDAVDERNYYVRCDRVREILGFEPINGLRDGIRELRDALLRGDIGDYRDPSHENHRSLKAQQDAEIGPFARDVVTTTSR